MSSSTRILYRSIAKASSSLSSACTTTINTSPVSSESSPEVSQSQQDCQSPPPLIEVKGIIFDMDGTLTIPVLNFREMRDRLGLFPGQDILPTVQSYPPDKRTKAMAIITELEEEGVKNMQLQPGILDLLHYIAERGVKRALMTRNSKRNTKSFLKMLNNKLSNCQEKYPHLEQGHIFSEVITREYEPCKPDPSAVLHICRQWQLQSHNVIIIGDDMTDMLCGIRAKTGLNILVKNDRNKTQVNYSNFTVDSLLDIMSLFSAPMEIVPKQENNFVE